MHHRSHADLLRPLFRCSRRCSPRFSNLSVCMRIAASLSRVEDLDLQWERFSTTRFPATFATVACNPVYSIIPPHHYDATIASLLWRGLFILCQPRHHHIFIRRLCRRPNFSWLLQLTLLLAMY